MKATFIVTTEVTEDFMIKLTPDFDIEWQTDFDGELKEEFKWRANTN